MDDSKQTLIADGTEFDGTVRSDCSIVVSGKVKGELSAPALHVTESGSVQGQVKVSRLHSTGEIAGEIEAEVIELAGRVSNQTVLRAKTLEVKLDQSTGGLQVTFDSCELQVGQDVADQKPESGKAKKSAKATTKPARENAGPQEKKEPGREPEPDRDIVDHAVDLLMND